MDKAELRSRTRQLAGAELDGLRSDDEIDSLVLEAYEQIGNHRTWRWREATDTFSTTASDAVYDIPSLLATVEGLVITDAPGQSLPVKLHEATLRDLLLVSRSEEDLPRYYARSGAAEIRLAPVPDAVYTVEVLGQKTLQGLPLEASTPEWDEQFHPAVAYLAASVLLSEEGQEELSLARKTRAEEFLLDMVNFYQRSRDDGLLVMGGGRRVAPVDRNGRLWPWR